MPPLNTSEPSSGSEAGNGQPVDKSAIRQICLFEDPPHGDDYIVKDNRLVQARYSMTMQETRLFILMLSKIRKDDTALPEFEIPVSSISNTFGVQAQSLYGQMEKVCDRLSKRVVHVPIDKEGRSGFVKYPLTRKSSYVEGDAYIIVAFNHDLAPYLIQLKDRFTRFTLKATKNFSSVYTFRIYDLLQQYWPKFAQRYLSAEDLAALFMLEGNSKKSPQIQRNVIDRAKKDLDKHGDITFKYEKRKKGRKTVGWDVLIYPTERYDPSVYQEDKINLSRFPDEEYDKLYEEAFERLDNHVKRSRTSSWKSKEKFDRMVVEPEMRKILRERRNGVDEDEGRSMIGIGK